MADTRYTALVLAASRGNLDPLAQAGGVSHKCFIDIAGQPMLRRVVEAVIESGRVGRIDRRDRAGERWTRRRRSSPASPAREPIDYVAIAREYRHQRRRGRAGVPTLLPLIITTGDNALHTARDGPLLLRRARRRRPTTARSASPRPSYVLEKYPEGQSRLPPLPRRRLLELQPLRVAHAPRRSTARAGLQQRRPVRQEAEAADRRLRPVRLPALQEPAVQAAHRPQASSRARSACRTAPVLHALRRRPDRRRPDEDWELANRIVREREGTA